MKPITRGDAHLAGMSQYFTAKTCKNGHVSPRYVSTGSCIACLRAYQTKFAGSTLPGVLLLPAQIVHADDADKIYAAIDYLNSARGLKPAVRAGVNAVLPTEWEVYLAAELKKPRTARPSLVDLRKFAAARGISEAYASTDGPPVDDWSGNFDDVLAEQRRRLGAEAKALDAEGYGPNERPRIK